MQPQDSGGVSRRALDVEDYIDVIRRHKAWILGPFFAAMVLSVVVAFLWPDTYISSAVIRVLPPQVPENFVPSNINTDVQGRVNSMAQGILNRATLTNIINTQGLYQKERQRGAFMDELVDQMRSKDIRIGAVSQPLAQNNNGRPQYPAFQISFAHNNRFTAKKVTENLVARLIAENRRLTTEQTEGTTGFLKDEWQSAKDKLNVKEQELSKFRSEHIGKLPEEQTSNYQQLNAMQVQVLNLNTGMSRVNQEKLMLENQLRIFKDEYSSLKDPNSQEQFMQQRNDKLAEKDKEVTAMEDMLTRLRDHYKDTYPDVQTAIARLAALKKQRDELAKEQADKKPEAAVRAANPQFVREARDLDGAIKRIQGQIEAKDLEMQDLQKQSERLSAAIKNYQERIAGNPVGIKEYDELMRDRDLAKRDFEDLDKRYSVSKTSTALERAERGERLDQLDEPTLPETPALPNRPLVIAIGSGLGLVLGLFLAGAREVKDTSLKNLKDVRAYTQLPILGSIPLLENDLVVRRRKRLGWLAWSTACLVGIVIMSSSVVYYYSTKL